MENRGDRKDYRREYYMENKEKFCKDSREYYAKNKEKISNDRKEYYAKNKEKISKGRKEYYAEKNERLNKERHDNERENFCLKEYEQHVSSKISESLPTNTIAFHDSIESLRRKINECLIIKQRIISDYLANNQIIMDGYRANNQRIIHDYLISNQRIMTDYTLTDQILRRLTVMYDNALSNTQLQHVINTRLETLFLNMILSTREPTISNLQKPIIQQDVSSTVLNHQTSLPPAIIPNTTAVPANVRKLVYTEWLGTKNGPCPCCLRSMIDPFHFHIAHIVARSQGGPNEPDNLIPVCSDCNLSMKDKFMPDFIRRYGLWKGRVNPYYDDAMARGRWQYACAILDYPPPSLCMYRQLY